MVNKYKYKYMIYISEWTILIVSIVSIIKKISVNISILSYRYICILLPLFSIGMGWGPGKYCRLLGIALRLGTRPLASHEIHGPEPLHQLCTVWNSNGNTIQCYYGACSPIGAILFLNFCIQLPPP